MRRAAQLLLLGALAATPAAAADGAREAHRATAAVQLTALAERIAKLHAQIAQGVLAERSRRAMTEALRGFESNLREVAAASPTPEIRDNYVLLALLWPEYREWARKPATRDNARDRKSTRLNSSHIQKSRMPSSA